MKRLLFVILLCSIASAAQVMQISVGNTTVSGAPAGTAPTIVTAVACASANLNCSTCCFDVAAGDATAVVWTQTPGDTIVSVTTTGDDLTALCTAQHVFGNNGTRWCFKAVSTGGTTMTYTCNTSSSTQWNDCIFFSIHCASTCTLENAVAFTDITGTGAAGDAVAAAVVTAHQQNELVVGGFTVNGNLTITDCAAGTGWTIPTGGSSCVPNSRAAAVVYKSVTATGSYTPTLSETVFRNTIGIGVSIY